MSYQMAKTRPFASGICVKCAVALSLTPLPTLTMVSLTTITGVVVSFRGSAIFTELLAIADTGLTRDRDTRLILRIAASWHTEGMPCSERSFVVTSVQ